MPQQCIRIGSAQYKNLLKHELRHNLQALGQQGINIRLTEDVADGFTFLDCYVAGHSLMEPAVYRQVAQKIADLIVNSWENSFIKDIIRVNFYYFDHNEKSIIFDYAQKKLHHNWKIREKNRSAIKHKLTECLGDYQKVFIEGFIRFRLKDYVQLLHDITEQAVDDFLMDRECKEFIELLQYFVAIQEPQVDLVHVVARPDGSFQLYDDQRQVIDSDYLRDMMLDLTDNHINYEDLLISALITIAPRDIKFHTGGVAEECSILDTISSVFTRRVTICTGCRLCQ